MKLALIALLLAVPVLADCCGDGCQEARRIRAQIRRDMADLRHDAWEMRMQARREAMDARRQAREAALDARREAREAREEARREAQEFRRSFRVW